MQRAAQLEGANAVRFYAALAIILYHIVKLTRMEVPPFLDFIGRSGGFGVPLFFVLSGFVLCVGYVGRLDGRRQIEGFYVRRFFRIAPLFYFMMCVYVFFLWARSGKFVPIELILSSATFTFNMIPGHTAGFVWASWSIGVEMIFYALFPVVILATTDFFRSLLVFLLALFVSVLWYRGLEGVPRELGHFRNLGFPSYFQYFLAGIVAYWVWAKVSWTRLKHICCIMFSCLLIAVLVSFSAEVSGISGRILGLGYARAGVVALWSIALAALVVGMGFVSFSVRYLTFSAWLGERSYSLYLWHPLVIGLIIQLGGYKWIAQEFSGPLSVFLVSVAITLSIVIAISIPSYEFLEKRLGGFLASRFRRAEA